MQTLVSVNGVALPTPSTYEANTATIVDSGRNVQGYVIGTVIRNNVSKVSLKWRFLTTRQWANAIRPFNENFYCTVTFFDQSQNMYVTKQMYVSDRSAGMYRVDPKTDTIVGWTDCALSLVEV